MNFNSINRPTITSVVPEVLQKTLHSIVNICYMLHQSPEYSQHIMYSTFEKEKLEFNHHVLLVKINDIRADSNVISRNTIFSIKIVENGSLKLQSRISPYSNEDSIKYQIKTDCCFCRTVGIKIVLSIAPIKIYTITN